MLITARELLTEAKKKGITDAEVCEAVDVHPVTLWRWRRGQNPRFDQLNKLINLVTGLGDG
jgi:transcriptional regulator with XRE-family HTH domain